MKKNKTYQPKPIKFHKMPIQRRMLFRRLWYVFAPLGLIAIIIAIWTIIQIDVKEDIKRINSQMTYQDLPEITENKEINANANDIVSDNTYTYDNPVLSSDSRIKQSGTGLSALTESIVRNTKKEISYADLNKYNRPGVITAYITSKTLTDSTINNTITEGVVTINMIPKAFGGETRKENNTILLGDAYANCYVPVMNSLLDYMKQTKNDIIIRITPSWSNIQFNMPDSIRIDAYSVNDLGVSLNTNFIISNTYLNNTIVDYRNPENNL